MNAAQSPLAHSRDRSQRDPTGSAVLGAPAGITGALSAPAALRVGREGLVARARTLGVGAAEGGGGATSEVVAALVAEGTAASASIGGAGRSLTTPVDALTSSAVARGSASVEKANRSKVKSASKASPATTSAPPFRIGRGPTSLGGGAFSVSADPDALGGVRGAQATREVVRVGPAIFGSGSRFTAGSPNSGADARVWDESTWKASLRS
jgi:hypothetical protein